MLLVKTDGQGRELFELVRGRVRGLRIGPSRGTPSSARPIIQRALIPPAFNQSGYHYGMALFAMQLPTAHAFRQASANFFASPLEEHGEPERVPPSRNITSTNPL